MGHSTKNRALLVFIFVLMAMNGVILLLAVRLFPMHGGFSREILFIKPYENEDGYYIILDELSPEAQNFEVDWMLHTRGDLELDPSGQGFTSTCSSFTTGHDISLKVSFLEKMNDIKEKTGFFYPEHFQKEYPDRIIPYVKASYSGSKSPIMAAILYPKDDDDPSQIFPSITQADGLAQIGDYHYLHYNLDEERSSFEDPNAYYDGKRLFIKSTDTTNRPVEYFFLEHSDLLNYQNIQYFSSSIDVNLILARYSLNNKITGAIELFSEEINTITLYCPFQNPNLIINDELQEYSWDDKNNLITFQIDSSCSFAISTSNNAEALEQLPLEETIVNPTYPSESSWKIDVNEIRDLKHPYILFNSEELNNLRTKINNNINPWKDWYDDYISGAEDILLKDIEDYQVDDRYPDVYKLVLKYAIEEDEDYFNKLKNLLLNMHTVTHYSQDLRRAYALQAYAVAYDIIYDDLTEEEQNLITSYLNQQATPFLNMEFYHKNNHRVVDAGGLGLVGLVLKNESMINIATETILNYFYQQNPADGGSFEGYSYIAYGFIEMIQFAVGLKNLGEFDFFKDEKIIRTLDYMSTTLGPLSIPPLFEDCTVSSQVNEVLLIAASQMINHNPLKARHYQYIWQKRQDNKELSASSDYGYIKGDGATFRKITCYNVDELIEDKEIKSDKEIWKESGMAFLRSEDDLYMAFSCKDYDQNHPHYDENSFELWAYGAYLVNNPGYPGWGRENHDWTQTSEASNTLVIDGSSQLQVMSEGFESCVISPYFSMVRGKAREIYNDVGSLRYTPQLIALLILSIIFCGICFFLNRSLEEQEKNSTLPEEPIPARNLSKISLIKSVFIKPKTAFSSVLDSDPFKENPKFFIEFMKISICTLSSVLYVCLMLNAKTMIDFHSQYYEDKYQIVFDLVPMLLSIILIGGAILVFFCSLMAINFYNHWNRKLTYCILKEQTDITQRDIDFVSMTSLAWQLPILILSAVLLYLTTINSLKLAIHGIFTELNSVLDVYQYLVNILLEFMSNILIIMIIDLPLLFLTVYYFKKGIRIRSMGQIDEKKGWKIPIISILLLLVVFFIIMCFLFMGFKVLWSSVVSIEKLTQY